MEEIKVYEKDTCDKEKGWSKYKNVLLMIIKKIRVRRSKYEASMKMYGP